MRYPAVLFVTGNADATHPVLLKHGVKAGHSGGMPVTKRVDDLADELGFMLWQTGGG